MILTDSGALLALIDADEQDHSRCLAVAARTRGPLLVTWPVVTEACYLLGRTAGWFGQKPLWALHGRGDLKIASLSEAAVARIPELMEVYRDRPMDLADASLVALAEQEGLSRVFTLDEDFRIYRLPAGKRFVVVP